MIHEHDLGYHRLKRRDGFQLVLRKSKRGENTATLYCTGRDIAYRELSLEFSSETHVWNLLSDDGEQTGQPAGRIILLLSALMREQSEICVPAKGCWKRSTCRYRGIFPQQLFPPDSQKRCRSKAQRHFSDLPQEQW